MGAVLIVAATTPILLALSRVETAGGWMKVDVLLPLIAGIVLAGVLLAWEREARAPMIPLRLFGNRIFTVATVISFTMSMVMIALIILVPLEFELAGGLAPNAAGARLIPMTGGTVLGSFIAGQLVSRTGRYRIFPIAGAGAMTAGCLGIALFGLGHSVVLDTVLTGILGLSFGFQLSPIIVPVQNALDHGDTGVGLACVMFFRLIGGAFGVALLSAVLMAELNTGVTDIPGHESLGANPGLALFHLEATGKIGATMLGELAGAIRTAFTHAFLYATAISGFTFLVSFGFKEIPLRGSPARPEPI